MEQVTEQHQKKIEKYVTNYHQAVIMRDGIKLATVVHVPQSEGTTPLETLLIRTPYSAIGMFGLSKLLAEKFPIKLNYVIQDCRGRYNSQGEFDMLNETNDTVDTMNWIASQEWSNGGIHIFGPSYMGWVALQVLQEKTDGKILSAFTPMTFSDPLDNAMYTDGIINLHHGYPFSMMMCSRVQGPLSYLNTPFPEAYEIAIEKGVTHQGYNPKIWDLCMDKKRLADLTINYSPDPSFDIKTTFVASYYDNVVRGSLKAFEKVNAIGGAKPNLIIGPWGHNGYINSLDSVGKFKITNAQANVTEHMLQHFNELNSNEPIIQVYILRLDKWITSNTWPLPTEKTTIPFMLNASNTEITATFKNPVRSFGGAVWDNVLVEGLDPGPYDQREINRRDDIIRLYSEPFLEDSVFAGRISVDFGVSVSLPESHVTAKLNLVEEDGTEYILQDGIKIIQEANSIQSVSVNLNYSAFQIKKGEKLMIELSWTNFPKYARPLHRSDYKLVFDHTKPVELHIEKYNNNLD